MKKLLSVLALSMAVLLVTSCDKAKKTERKITRKDGEWVIAKLNIKTWEEYEPETDQYYLLDRDGFANCGFFVFDKNSTITRTLTIDGETETSEGNWKNEAGNITLIEDGIERMYIIKEISRKELNLVYTAYYTIDNYDYIVEYTYELERE